MVTSDPEDEEISGPGWMDEQMMIKMMRMMNTVIIIICIKFIRQDPNKYYDILS